MTEITRKTSYAEAKAIYENSDNSSELRSKAKERMDSIKAWLDSKKEKGNSPKGSTGSARREIQESDFADLSDSLKTSVKQDTEDLLKVQLARIYYIEQYLKGKGINAQGPFVGMLFNGQVATN